MTQPDMLARLQTWIESGDESHVVEIGTGVQNLFVVRLLDESLKDPYARAIEAEGGTVAEALDAALDAAESK